MTKKKSRKIAAALGLAMVVALAPATALADYKLGISDRVKIKVQEWPDLTGEYTVTPDGVVSLPLVGNIKAAGLSLNELANQISDALQRRSDGAQRSFTAVEIAQYRPFAIMGDVQKPGQYPYRPGLTVLEAISLAGGYYRPELGLLRLGRDVANATGQIHTESAKLNQLLVREARLTAALDGREDIPMPTELAKLKDDPDISQLMKNEQSALALENEVKRADRAALDSIKTLYNNEIDTLQGQVQALAQERSSVETQLNELRSMASRGLALAPTMFALERSLGQVSNEQMSAETAIVRAHENITLAEQKVTQAQQERSRVDNKELQETRDKITEARGKIETETQLLHEAQTGAPAEARERLSQEGERPGFTILRRDGDKVRELVADEATLVDPDDVIKVPSVRPPPVGPSSTINLSRAAPPDR